MATVVVLAGGAAVSTAGSHAPAAPPTVRIDVVAKGFSFALSRRRVLRGAQVVFRVRNRGAVPHDFVIAGRRTRVLRPGQSATITTRFTRKGVKRFLCSVPGHARLGMKGTLGVSTPPPPAEPKPTTPPADVAGAGVRLTKIGDFERPVHVASPPGDPRTLYVVEQAGRIVVLRDGAFLPQPFLDIRDEVLITNEPGLLSIAFAPILELPHGPGDCSIIAGVVVRDPRLPALAGRFLFGDYCTGVVEADTMEDGRITDRMALGVIVPELSSFGVDGLGRVYLTSTAGAVYRLDPA